MKYSNTVDSKNRSRSLVLNPAIRLHVPAQLTEHWEVENILTRSWYAFDVKNVAILIEFVEECCVADALDNLSELELASSDILKRISLFLDRSILMDPEKIKSDPLLQNMNALLEQWDRCNWREAAEYHIATQDYPFIPQTEEGYSISRNRMSDYSEAELDFDRQKSYPQAYAHHPLPDPVSFLNESECLKSTDRPMMTKLAFVLSGAFCKIGEMRPQWNGLPLLLKTSPSGGCRHPTEGYVLLLSEGEYPMGWYHISGEPPRLEFIRPSKHGTDVVRRCFPNSVERCPSEIKAVLVITSVFARNMYRYREPRTFRTVHLDAGHIAGTVEMLAEQYKLGTFVQYTMNEESVAKELDINLMEEGPMATISFYNRLES